MCGLSKTRCTFDCTLLAVAVSLIAGVIAAFLRITAVITLAPAALITAFGIAVGFLAITLFVSTSVRCIGIRECICDTLGAIITGILGTILTSLILLAVTFAATSILGAVITGALVFFFTLIITSVACLIRCLAQCNTD